MRDGKSQLRRAPLPLLVSLALAVPGAAVLTMPAAAQSGDAIPGLYTSVDESEIYIIQPDGSTVDVRTGESVRVDASGVEFITSRPEFLNWPCGTAFAGARGSLPTFALDSLPPGDRIAQVVDRYFTEQQVLEGSPRWLNGESHGAFSAAEIDQFVSNAFWYRTVDPDPKMADKRPPTLLIALFYGTGQVVVDTNHLAELKEMYGDEPIPTVFRYEEENVVPISYFGDNATPQQILLANQQSGIRPADVPLWYAGDQHASADPGALADALGVPPASAMDPERLAREVESIEQGGLRLKPVTLVLVPGGDRMLPDDPERLRAAQQAGVTSVPLMFSVFDDAAFASQCGLPPPVAAVGVLGTKEGEAPGAQPPDETPDEPGDPGAPDEPGDPGGEPGTGPGEPPPEPPAPPNPPPEIVPPDPPPPELPVSDN